MIVVLTALFFQTSIAAAEEIRYKIDTKEGVNEEKTTAVVDIEKHEIRLPKFMPNMVDFLGDSFEYVVMTPEGVKKVNIDGNMEFEFPYLARQSTIVGDPTEIEADCAGDNKRWEIKFFTDANTDIHPDGTIVHGYLKGNGRPDLMILDQRTPTEKPTEGTWWQWEGYRKWVDGKV